jgi:serine/threonine-protein phosphatase 2A regulatory subunit A
MPWVSLIASLSHASNALQAAESITKIATVLTAQQIEQHYIPLLNRLSHGEWFTSRTSSAALYAPVYTKVSPAIQEELRKGFAALGSDDTPMVRRAAAKWLGVSARFLFLSVTC